MVVGAGLLLGLLAVFKVGLNFNEIRRPLVLIAMFFLMGLYQKDRFVPYPRVIFDKPCQ